MTKTLTRLATKKIFIVTANGVSYGEKEEDIYYDRMACLSKKRIFTRTMNDMSHKKEEAIEEKIFNRTTTNGMSYEEEWIKTKKIFTRTTYEPQPAANSNLPNNTTFKKNTKRNSILELRFRYETKADGKI